MKTWAKIDEVIQDYKGGNTLELKVHDTVVFDNEQVFVELEYFYSEFSFLVRDTDQSSSWRFNNIYQEWARNMGENFYRMNDALTREYNPLNNYEMVESGTDGRKMSERSMQSTQDDMNGEKRGTITNDDTGGVTKQSYTNAFNDFSTSSNTPTSKDVITNDNKQTATTYGSVDDTSQDNIAFSGYNNIEKTHNVHSDVETYKNDVSLKYKKDSSDGTFEDVTAGTDYAEGTEHNFTRSGNIGVTTSAQMISGELELRKANLLKDYVRGFIMRYCSYISEWE